MNSKICVLTVLAVCIGLLLTGFSTGLLETSVSLSFNGVMQQTSTTPAGTYSYIINVSGLNYQMTNGITGQVGFQSKNASQVINDAIGNLTGGGNILFGSGTYNLQGSISGFYEDNVSLAFADGAMLFVANGMNAPAINLIACNNWTISGVTINGNAANQIVAQTCDGIRLFACTNCLVDDANIYNCRIYGFFAFGANSVNAIDDGINDSKITCCGWNGITLGGWGGELSLYATNDEVAYCGDVGITNFGIGDIITANYVHDMNGTTGSNDARWGIAAEGGGNDTITGNTIYNVESGVTLSSTGSGNCTVSQNIIYNWDTYNWSQPAINVLTNSNLITENQIISNGTYSNEQGIGICGNGNVLSTNEITLPSNGYAINIGSDATNTTISGNDINAVCTINDEGPDTRILDNQGYNPVGYISNPINPREATLIDKGSSSTWISGTIYTDWESPKILYISGGTVTAIVYDGQILYTSATNCSITLYPGDTFSVTFSTAPTINAYGQ